MKIITEPVNQGIPVTEMQDGQIGVIVAWGDSKVSVSEYLGLIVQRYGGDLVVIGKSYTQAWDSYFIKNVSHPFYRVRILPKGTVIEL